MKNVAKLMAIKEISPPGGLICDKYNLLSYSSVDELSPPRLGKITPHLWEGMREGRSYVDTTSPFIITTFSKLRDYNYYEVHTKMSTINIILSPILLQTYFFMCYSLLGLHSYISMT